MTAAAGAAIKTFGILLPCFLIRRHGESLWDAQPLIKLPEPTHPPTTPECLSREVRVHHERVGPPVESPESAEAGEDAAGMERRLPEVRQVCA